MKNRHKLQNKTMKHLLLLPLLLVALRTCLASAEEAECTSTSAPYSGVDVSYPIHSMHTISDNPLGDKATWYDNLINGCRESCDRCKAACDQTEKDRILMNRRQPQSMVNYTDFGIKKIRVSPTCGATGGSDHWFGVLFAEWPQEREQIRFIYSSLTYCWSGNESCLRGTFAGG